MSLSQLLFGWLVTSGSLVAAEEAHQPPSQLIQSAEGLRRLRWLGEAHLCFIYSLSSS